MIPLELEIEGLHSYRDPVTIPFEDVVGQGFFGIFGATGSGKSTILDAITLALYGRVDRFLGGSGGRVTPMMNLASDELVVDFRFRLADTEHRARRRFVRVDEETVQQRDAELVDLEDGVALASQAREVNRTVEGLLGMDFDQFTRAVFLPQGKFAQFLDDQASDRIRLLEDLFGLDRFGDRLRRSVGDRTQEVREEHTNLQGQLEQLAAYDEETLEDLAAQHEEAAEHVDELEERRDELEPKVQAARELESLLEDREEARAALEALEERADEVDELREELALARAAQEPYDVLETLRSERETRDALEEAVEALALELEQARTDLETFLEQRDERAGELRAARDDLVPLEGVLDELSEHRHRLSQLRTEREQRAASLDQARSDQQADRGEHPEPPDELCLEEARELVTHAAEGRHRAGTVADREQALQTRSQRVETLGDDLAGLDERIDALEDELADAEEQLASAQRAREEMTTSNHAAVLVETLETGEPCPVCGSTDHPAPAEPPDEALETVETRVETAREARETALTELEAARSRRETLAEQLQQARSEQEAAQDALEQAREAEQAHREQTPVDGIDVDTWERMHARAQAWTTALEAQENRERLAEIDAQLERSRERWRSVTELLDLDAEHPTEDALGRARTRLEGRVQELDEALAALDEREAELREAVGDLEAERAGKRERLEDVTERIAGLEAKFEEALDGTPFEAPEALEAAYRPPERVESLERTVTSYEQERRDVERDLERLDEQVDEIELTGDEAQTVREAWTGLEDRLASARTQRDKLAQQVEVHREKLETRQTLEARYEEVDELLGRLEELKRLLRGRGFVEYLARARFEAVLHQASQRLAEISGGRYHLRGSPREIAIVDHMSGSSARDLRTLSGGERFMVSLSLALALSDAIQDERGGGYPPVEFFFLDEGFGSLDGDTLDAVMHLLQSLAEQGTHVGLITHVEAAKRYVPARIEVEGATEERGSRVEVRR